MRQVIADCWAIDLPEEWQATQDEDCIILCDDDNVSTIEIVAMRKLSGEVTDDELAEYAEDLNAQNLPRKEVAVGDFDGFVYQYQDGEDWCRDWFLMFRDVFLFASYTCLVDDKDLDDAAVDTILDTLIYREVD